METLHGAYYIWDLGDRPENLIADIGVARVKLRKMDVPADIALVKKDTVPPPAAPPTAENKATSTKIVPEGPLLRMRSNPSRRPTPR